MADSPVWYWNKKPGEPKLCEDGKRPTGYVDAPGKCDKKAE